MFTNEHFVRKSIPFKKIVLPRDRKRAAMVPPPLEMVHADIGTAIDEKQRCWFCAKDIYAALELNRYSDKRIREKFPVEWLTVLCFKNEHAPATFKIYLNESALAVLLYADDRRGRDWWCLYDWAIKDVVSSYRRVQHAA